MPILFAASSLTHLPSSGTIGDLQTVLKQLVCLCVCVSVCVCLSPSVFAAPWTVAFQAPRSVGFSRKEYWNGLPFPTPEDCPDPGIKLTSLASPALAGGFFTTAPSAKS